MLSLTFGKKQNLPETLEVRICAADDFAFATPASQDVYDKYYASIVNDYVHSEVTTGPGSPIALQEEALLAALPLEHWAGKRVLDYGCGQAHLLRRLAGKIPSAQFTGYDPNPGAVGIHVENLRVVSDFTQLTGKFDIIIMSHVLEHMVSFSSLAAVVALASDNAFVYAEVPDAARYPQFPRRSFLYYFDRIHLNHFTTRSLYQLIARYGFRLCSCTTYEFPYTDGLPYPALGMLLHKDGEAAEHIASPRTSELADALPLYLHGEQARSLEITRSFSPLTRLLVWGGGDNFHRALSNGGPLSSVDELVLLDRTPKDMIIGGRHFRSIPPEEGLGLYDDPVAITVSEASATITKQIQEIAPGRRVFVL